jgi:hypothetical protein
MPPAPYPGVLQPGRHHRRGLPARGRGRRGIPGPGGTGCRASGGRRGNRRRAGQARPGHARGDQAARCIDAGIIDGDQTDIAHGLLALAQGLATQEAAGWLGSTQASVNRRWDLAVHALLAGLARPGSGNARRTLRK